MSVVTTLKLGQSTSLLSGYKAKAIIGSHNEIPFIPSPKGALNEIAIDIGKPNHDAKWSYPTITLCNDVEELVSAMLQIRLRLLLCQDSPPSKWPSGAVMLAGLTPQQHAGVLTELSGEIGLDLTTPNRSYALVCRSREVGTSTHHCYERGIFGDPKPNCTLKPETLKALKRLEKLSKDKVDVTLEGARGYTAFFETFGTHFVSSVTVGDILFQVFAYESSEYEKVVEAYKHNPGGFSGPTAQSFVYFTVPHRKSTRYGFTVEIGQICIASGDPALAEALRDGLWMDDRYALKDSIFTPYLRSDSVNVNTAFKRTVVTSIELSSLEVFAEYFRKLIFRSIFKAAMYCRYHEGTGVEPHFVNSCPYNVDSIFKDSDPISGDGLVSNIATPSISIFKERFELNSLHIEFADTVKMFSIFTNVLTVGRAEKMIEIPGSNDVTLISHVIAVTEPLTSTPKPQTLCLSEIAYSEIKAKVICNKFYGGLLITTKHCTKALVIANGLVFEVINGGIAVTADVRSHSITSNNAVQEHVTNLQFSLVAAEARLNYLLAVRRDPNQNVDEALTLVRSFLSWLGNSSSNESHLNAEVLNVQARAACLAKLTDTDQCTGIPVPYLKYKAYKDVVESVKDALGTIESSIQNFQEQIRARKAEEREIDRQKALNENIIKSGNLLEKYISAQAEYQESIANQLSSVAAEKVKKLKEEKQKMQQLSDALEEQRQTVKDDVESYKEAVTDWETREMIKAGLNIASSLFALGFTFVAPASSISALKDLGATVQRIQKAVKVFDAVIKTYEAFKSLPKSPHKVIQALSDVGPEGIQLPSSQEWDEMKINMEATLAQGPTVGAKVTLSAAFSILVLRGKALIESQNTIQSLASELSSTEQQILISQQQKKRLGDLKANFSAGPQNLNVEAVDLVGLTGQLLFFQRQMLLTLASVIVTQDAALQYEYLQPPVPINSFSLLDLQLTIVNQALTINHGLTVQPPPMTQDKPIIYEIHGVKPKDITYGNAFTFSIGLSKREFASFNYVRVSPKGVDAEIGGIASTDSGQYYIELMFEGQPFYDRDFNGEPRTFCTNSRPFTFRHDVSSSTHFKILAQSPPSSKASGVPQFSVSASDDPFIDNISDITPFSTWKISLPPTDSNKGIQFDDDSEGLTVRLTFHIFAQLKETLDEADASLRSAYLRSRIGENMSPCVNPYKHLAALMNSMGLSSSDQDVKRYLAQMSSTSQDVSKMQVLDMMKDKSVCAGWDVVFSMTAKQVNTQLARQYDDRVGQPTFVREINEPGKESKNSEGNWKKTSFSFQFKAPRLQFLLNNSNSARVYFPIKSGTCTIWIKLKGQDWQVFGKASVKESDGAYVQGDVPLSSFQGTVSTQHSVVVELNKGSFSAQKLSAGVADDNMREVLTDYFTGLKDGYQLYKLGTLDLNKVTVLPELTPTAFKFNVYHTPSDRDLLQLFIATTGQPQSATSLYLREPIPSIYESSLIVSSEIFFKAVLPASLGDGGGLRLTLTPNNPQSNSNNDKAWSATASSGSITVPYEPQLVKSYSVATQQGLIIYYKDWVGVPNDETTLNLVGMKFEYSDSGSVQMNFSMINEYIFKYGSQFQSCGFSCSNWSDIAYHNYKLQVTVHSGANLPITVAGSGKNQSLVIQPTDSDVDIDGNLEPPAGACKCNDRDLQKSFLDSLQRNMKPKLKTMFKIQFTPVSIFALKNILFPAKNLIDMKEAALPGDLVVFGNFTGDDD